MPSGLDPSVAARLAKITGLLASEHDGERAAAAAAATRLLHAQGLTWHDVFAPTPAARTPGAGPVAPHAAEARWALEFPDQLTSWERVFLGDIARRGRLSAKQRAALSGITQRLRKGGTA